jgi:predicted nicotinamide N-methyase
LQLLNQNLSENRQDNASQSSKGRKSATKSKRGSAPASQPLGASNIVARPLDWETDEVIPSLTGSEDKSSFDVIIACDCIYNDALIDPLVQTCIDACKLRALDATRNHEPTVCVVAQQLRSAEVFEGWLKAYHKAFRVWRVPNEELVDGLKEDSGFVLHIGVLRV